MSETYYAVRIGRPRVHTPYLMLDDRTTCPRLFSTKEEAQEYVTHYEKWRKVVPVKLTTK